ncbi:hypothetical protein [Lichenibacterium dinghuense]|uniref:hypothetical protein n=1 Tax=Lichenibacterium dinghuense TaxID=2895977 RepID=UPI001F2DEA24|nr:hypothetical protein [Lichenibacterium sp. 6Y81]
MMLVAFDIACASQGVCAEAVTEPDLKGFGVKGVTGATLADMLARCSAAGHGAAPLEKGETPALLDARCAQLRRSLKTQPGNSPSPTRR